MSQTISTSRVGKRQSLITIGVLGGPPPVYPVGGAAEVEMAGLYGVTGLEGLAETMALVWAQRFAPVLPERPDLLVMPEMSDRYLGTPPEVLVALHPVMYVRMTALLSQFARDNRCYIVHPTAVPGDDGTWYNGARLFDRDGEVISVYRKVFLVDGEREKGLLPGAEPCVVECDFGRLGFAICFDLNFTELLGAYRALKPDVIVFPSNYHGGLMQPYWAYQLRAHFVGAMGVAGVPSEVYSPLGQRLASSTNYFSHVTARVNLDAAVVHLDHHWEKLRALKERYGRDVVIEDPGHLGAVLVTSELSNRSVAEMLSEFQIETLDVYLDRSRCANAAIRDRRALSK